jgi:N-acetylmuramoyl-L-alanine amidase
MLPLSVWDRLVDLWYAYDGAVVVTLWVVPVVIIGLMGTMARFAYTQHQEMRAAVERRIEVRCLAENVYYEGRGEPLPGQYAVAEVTMNRVASARFPGTVCGVVHEKRLDAVRGRYVGAFSWTELELRAPVGPAWVRAVEVATDVYDLRHQPVVPDALFYHATRVEPSWAKVKQPLTRIGNHVFYR